MDDGVLRFIMPVASREEDPVFWAEADRWNHALEMGIRPLPPQPVSRVKPRPNPNARAYREAMDRMIARMR
jgi:hypothetical protein